MAGKPVPGGGPKGDNSSTSKPPRPPITRPS